MITVVPGNSTNSNIPGSTDKTMNLQEQIVYKQEQLETYAVLSTKAWHMY